MVARDWSTNFASADRSALQSYEDVMVPALFLPWALMLLDAVEVNPGATVVDVACGPGTVAREAARRAGPTGTVTGCDISPAMLDLARAKPSRAGAAPITYVECPADRLDVPSGTAAVVTCQHGLQFFSDRPAALAEMHRVLHRHGRLGIAVWANITAVPPFDALSRAIAVVLGEAVAARYRSGPWGLADPGLLTVLAEGAGFHHIRVEQHTLPFDIHGGVDALLSTLPHTAVGAEVSALSREDAYHLRQQTAAATAPFLFDGAIHSTASALLLTATR